MDRSLDDVISERQRNNYRGSRDRRPNNWPRDGVRKSSQRSESRNLDRDWVHDRYEDDSDTRRPARGPRGQRTNRYTPETDPAQSSGAKLKVENLHYDLTEDDLRELFTRIGRILSVSLLYDRQDRSKGIAFITYAHLSDARTAIREFDGANANGQPIRLTLMPPPVQPKTARNPFDTAERPGRSLFERIDDGGRRRDRSASPGEDIRHSDVSKPAPDHIDRYVPGQRSRRSPPPRRGSGRDMGRRPGARPEDSGRREPRRGDDGRPMVQGRPRKTAEELDAEMADYWGNAGEGNGTAANAGAAQNGGGVTGGAPEGLAATTTTVNDDIDMIE